MSDAATEVAPSPTGSLANALSGITGTIAKELPVAIESDRADRKVVRDAAMGAVSEIDKAKTARGGMAAPPVPPPQPPPQFQETGMTDRWGSLAMGMAVLGSAFTRRPAINSMNAAAATLNAYNASDAASYKRNFDQWKAETEYSLKMYEYQRDAYKDALSGIDKNVNDAMAKVSVIAHAFKHDAVAETAKVGNVAATLAQINEADARLPKLQAETAAAKVQGELINRFNVARDALRKNPNDPAARQEMQAIDAESKRLKTIQGGAGSVTDQNFEKQTALEKELTDEWVANNPGKPLTASTKAEITAKARGSIAGKTETPTSARESALKAAVEADVEKFKLDNPGATPEQIDDARWKSRLKHEGELGRATRQPRSASAMSLDSFIEEYKRENEGRMPSSKEIQTYQAVGIGKSQEARTTAARAAGLELAGATAEAIIPLVKEASAAIDRTQYPDLNRLILAYETRTGDPKVVQYAEMINSIRYLYARALSPTGAARVEDIKRADDVIDKAWTNGQINAALDQIQRFINVERDAVKRVMEQIGKGGIATAPGHATGGAVPAAAPPAAGAVPASAAGRPPPPEAIADLKRSDTPTMRRQFDEIFGPGAAAKAIGR